MIIVGKIEKIVDKSTPRFKKKVAVIHDSIDNTSIWCVELRKQLFYVASALKQWDRVEVTFYNDGRMDDHGNHYNNIIAEKIERI